MFPLPFDMSDQFGTLNASKNTCTRRESLMRKFFVTRTSISLRELSFKSSSVTGASRIEAR